MKGKRSAKPKWTGFTLIELMIVVAIIGILAAIAVPKFAQLIRKSSEGATKGNLGALRSALSIYYGDNGGAFPATLATMSVSASTAAPYIQVVPVATEPPYHGASSVEQDVILTAWTDSNGWIYDNNASDTFAGTVMVACTHTDTKGSSWSTY
jgi:prepilin-type N-terminal cleavage/methylation domain-containing protein